MRKGFRWPLVSNVSGNRAQSANGFVERVRDFRRTADGRPRQSKVSKPFDRLVTTVPKRMQQQLWLRPKATQR